MITEFSKAVCVPELDILETKRPCGGRGRMADIREAYWLLLYENGFNYNEIGRLCDRTHATILSGVKRIRQLLESGDRETLRIYELTKHIKRYENF